MSRHHHYNHHHGSGLRLRSGTIGYTIQSFFMSLIFLGIGCFLIYLFATGGGVVALVVALFLFGFAALLVFLGIRSHKQYMAGGPPDMQMAQPSQYPAGGQMDYYQRPPPP